MNKELYRIEDLKKSYGKQLVINGLNLVINEREFVLIIGDSGCGKTALLNILSLQDFYFEGSCFLCKDYRKINALPCIN